MTSFNHLFNHLSLLTTVPFNHPSKAWMWSFSSTDSTRAFSGGFRYRGINDLSLLFYVHKTLEFIGRNERGRAEHGRVFRTM